MADGWPRPEMEIGVELLSPLHVGSGSAPLLSDLDFAVHQGNVWVVDHRRLAELFSDEELRGGVPDIRLSRLLGPDRYPAFAAYSLTARGAVGNQIIPCVKDAEGRPYLPGSSLKGALRSSLAWAAAGEQGHAPTGQELGRSSRYAALQWERRVFGATPTRTCCGPFGSSTPALCRRRVWSWPRSPSTRCREARSGQRAPASASRWRPCRREPASPVGSGPTPFCLPARGGARRRRGSPGWRSAAGRAPRR